MGICSFDAVTAGFLHTGIDDSQQAGGRAVHGDEDHTLTPTPEAVGPITEPFDGQSQFGESLGVADHDAVAFRGAGCQREQFLLGAAVERHNRDERWFQHGSKIPTRLRTSPSRGVEFLL